MSAAEATRENARAGVARLTPAWTNLRYHEQQSKLWRSPARFKAVAAGRGSGKTELARRYLVRQLPIVKPWADPLYFLALPTYNQAKRIAWDKVKALIPRHWITSNGIHESELSITTVFGSTLFLIGMDKPQRLEGNQYDGGIIDESSDQKPKSFDLSVRPALTHRKGFCWRIGVPKRAGVGAAEFKEFFFKEQDDKESYAWPSEDILSPEECAAARESMDEKDYNEQFRASWETLSGLVFYSFSDVLNVSPKVQYYSNLPILIGSDFNVDPMAWVLCQAVHNELHVFDEVFLRNTNTQAALDYVHNKYGGHAAGFRFFGDSAGRHRHSSASTSDYMQIKGDERFVDSRVNYPLSNPVVMDRFAACNAMFCNANKTRRCFVHPRCKNLIKDLMHRSFKPGETEPDDSAPDTGHITDALGYLIYMVYPFRIRLSQKTPEVYG